MDSVISEGGQFMTLNLIHSGTWGNKGVARIAGHPVCRRESPRALSANPRPLPNIKYRALLVTVPP